MEEDGGVEGKDEAVDELNDDDDGPTLDSCDRENEWSILKLTVTDLRYQRLL